jgi:hypothetical protein
MKGLHSNAILEGVRFPVENGYIELKNATAHSLIAREIVRVLLGPVTVSGTTWMAYYSNTPSNDGRGRPGARQ